ncbi:MAG TPA: hypothetical protein EYP59_18970 [Thiotrichaceae bacterium]|nr:hypothetical protein [Thiotrichaceae bacterium]
MVNFYYEALKEQGQSADELRDQVSESLNLFGRYLHTAISALKNKEVKCRWEPVSGYEYQLTPKSKVYQWQLWTEIRIQGDEPGWFWITKDLDDEQPPSSDFQPDFEETIRIGKGIHAQKIQCSSEQLQRQGSRWRLFLGTEFEAKQINWSGYRLEIEPIQAVPCEPQNLRFKGEEIAFSIVNTQPLQLKVRAELHQGDTLQINDNEYAIELIRTFDKKQLPAKVYQCAEGRYWTCNQPKLTLELCERQDITSEYLSTLTPDKLTGENWDIEGYEAWQATSNNIHWTMEKRITQTIKPKDERLPELTFDLTITEPDKKWIQLLEDTEENDDRAESGQSTLEHFFSDNVSILDANDPKKAYRILKANYEEKRLLLAKDKSANSVYPPKDTHLKVKVELGSLRKQQDAITKLRKTPPPQLKGLIQLVNARQQVQWPITSKKPIENWTVLTDLAYDGCDSQRQFVQKALATPDFAILDGPPGTGKTTTILELIIQLVERDQRVLLCGSTHAAINNVLERISEQKLLDKIFPLRIGDENRAIGVEEFQYDNVLKQFQKNGIDSEQLLVDTANLVCGTTMGILRLFREEKVNLDRGIPPFDVLIVDECSKTPFQEFIVPAIYAKRWILVGDVRQLSPFTDRDVIVGNLRELFLPKGKGKGDYLNKNLQKACFYLQALFPYKNQFVIPESGAVIEALAQEINARIETEEKLLDFALIIEDKASDSKDVLWYDSSESNFYRTDLEPQAWCLYDYDFIFIEHALYKTHSHLMPADAIVLDAHWQSSAHAFRHQARWQGQQALKQRNQNLTDSFEIQQNRINFLQSRDWADELVWRLEREYWLRFLTDRRQRNRKGKKTRIEEQLQRLFPQSEAAEGRIYQIRNIAFPSVLEALSGEGITKHRKDMPTTLNQGFYAAELKCRYTTLTYQHRMHPAIAEFSRKMFYTPKTGEHRVQSLLDGHDMANKRNWTYQRYSKHRYWLNVAGKVLKNANQKEVDAIRKELEAFIQWATKNQNPETRAWEIAILTFYKKQETTLREMLKKLTGTKAYSRFPLKDKNVLIKLATVDFFQGQEADLVFLSMVNTYRDGFLDSPNRLNVAVTRARYQLVIVGDQKYFSEGSETEELNQLAKTTVLIK